MNIIVSYTTVFHMPTLKKVCIVFLQLRFVFDNGAEPVVLDYLPPSPLTLCNNQWHTISVIKDGITGTLSLNGEVVVSMSSSDLSFVSLDIDSPLYVGGVPSESTHIFFHKNLSLFPSISFPPSFSLLN